MAGGEQVASHLRTAGHVQDGGVKITTSYGKALGLGQQKRAPVVNKRPQQESKGRDACKGAHCNSWQAETGL